MTLLRELKVIGRVLDPDVQEYIASRTGLQQDLGSSADLHRGVDANLDRLGVSNLSIVLVDKTVQRVADRFHHVVVVQRSLRAFVEINDGELQPASCRSSPPELRCLLA